jgi:hypothetical protein
MTNVITRLVDDEVVIFEQLNRLCGTKRDIFSKLICLEGDYLLRCNNLNWMQQMVGLWNQGQWTILKKVNPGQKKLLISLRVKSHYNLWKQSFPS